MWNTSQLMLLLVMNMMIMGWGLNKNYSTEWFRIIFTLGKWDRLLRIKTEEVLLCLPSLPHSLSVWFAQKMKQYVCWFLNAIIRCRDEFLMRHVSLHCSSLCVLHSSPFLLPPGLVVDYQKQFINSPTCCFQTNTKCDSEFLAVPPFHESYLLLLVFLCCELGQEVRFREDQN